MPSATTTEITSATTESTEITTKSSNTTTKSTATTTETTTTTERTTTKTTVNTTTTTLAVSSKINIVFELCPNPGFIFNFNSFLKYKMNIIDVVLGFQTKDCRIVCVEKSIDLYWAWFCTQNNLKIDQKDPTVETTWSKI